MYYFKWLFCITHYKWLKNHPIAYINDYKTWHIENYRVFLLIYEESIYHNHNHIGNSLSLSSMLNCWPVTTLRCFTYIETIKPLNIMCAWNVIRVTHNYSWIHSNIIISFFTPLHLSAKNAYCTIIVIRGRIIVVFAISKKLRIRPSRK